MRLIFACGGTGGHIFPAFSVAEEIKKRRPDTDIWYICGNKEIENEVFGLLAHEKVVSIPFSSYPRGYQALNPFYYIRAAWSFITIFFQLAKIKPRLVVGFGGYTAFPVMIAAFLQRRKTLIHEQNVVPGLANRILLNVVDHAALSFEETKKYIKHHKKCIVTGNPIRSFIEKGSASTALDFFQFSVQKITWLVLGGSQGSQSINSVFLEAIQQLPNEIKQQIQILHLCGRMPKHIPQEVFRSTGITGKAFAFFDRMDLAYAISDCVLGRAGATFLAEINKKNITSILVPYPFGDRHQYENARVFAQTHDAIVLDQKNLSAENLSMLLIKKTQKALEHQGRDVQSLSQQCQSETQNARIILADLIFHMSR